jgi:MFS family permease
MPQLTRLKFLVYSQQFTSECMLIYPFYALMFSEHSGLSTGEISLLFGWWVLIALVSELPTGILADKFSKKSALFSSKILQALGFAVWLFFPSFMGYAIGFLLWGVGYAFNSGAFQAYLYDELATQKSHNSFTKLYARSQSLALIGMVIAYIVAALLGPNYAVLLIASIVVSLLSAVVTLAFPSAHSATTPAVSHLDLLKGGFKEVRHSSVVLHIVVSAAFIIAIGSVVEEYVPLYYNLIGVVSNFIPLLLAIGLGLSAILAWTAHRFEDKSNIFQLLTIAIAGILLFITSYNGMVVATLGMVIFMRLIKLSSLLYETSLQHNITERYRATVGSIPTFIAEIISLGIFALYGFISQLFGDMTSIRFIGIIVLGVAIGLFLYWGKKKIPSKFPKADESISVEQV